MNRQDVMQFIAGEADSLLEKTLQHMLTVVTQHGVLQVVYLFSLIIVIAC